MKRSEWLELKKQGYVIDKEKTPLNEQKYFKDFFRGGIKSTECYTCEFGEFNGKQYICSKGNGPFNDIYECPRHCKDKEIDDYYYDLDKIVIKK